MSQVIIAGDTSGTITLQAPAVAGSSVLTLPATTATLATLTTPSFASTIGVGGATASASGAGISFPATQSASSDANTLDDYERGSWTPVASSGTGSITTYSSIGAYVKTGRNLFISGSITLTTVGTAGGSLRVSSLPFTPANITNNYGVSSETQQTGIVYSVYLTGTTQIAIVTYAGGAITWTSGSVYQFSMTYQTSS